MTAPLLKVDNLAVEFGPKSSPVRAVNGVSFEIEAGGALGIVGESGAGQSITSFSILRLIPEPPRPIVQGRGWLQGG